MNNDLLKSMAQPLQWAQPLKKPPYLLKPIEIPPPPPSFVDGLIQALVGVSDGLYQLAADFIKAFTPVGMAYREAYIARAIPAWGKRHKMLKVKALPAPKEGDMN
jgi:hypothetical protein